MTGVAGKKKRFEGLIQFQEPLRQALVSLQAAHGDRFATAFQSDFLKAKDTTDLSHFILTSDGSTIGDLTRGLEARHLMISIEQLSDNVMDWKKTKLDPDAKISAWLSSGDPLACQQLYSLLALASSEARTFDLKSLKTLGALSLPFETAAGEAWMSEERMSHFKDFEADASRIMRTDKRTIVTDGCTVSLIIEGNTKLSADKAFEKALIKLRKNTRHFVGVNYVGGSKPRLQCVYLTPMRLPLKELQTSALRGFVLLRDIKEKAHLPKSVLAS